MSSGNDKFEKASDEMDFENALSQQLPTLRRTAIWITGDEHRAEDLVQDTVVLALRFKQNFQEGTNMRAWLIRVMRNRHISAMRRKTLERKVMETEGRHTLAEWSVGEAGRRSTEMSGNVYCDDGFCDTVADALGELRPEFRDVVMLCDVEGLSYADAADRVSCPVGTVMSRLHRGRRALRSRLGSRRLVDAAA